MWGWSRSKVLHLVRGVDQRYPPFNRLGQNTPPTLPHTSHLAVGHQSPNSVRPLVSKAELTAPAAEITIPPLEMTDVAECIFVGEQQARN